MLGVLRQDNRHGIVVHPKGAYSEYKALLKIANHIQKAQLVSVNSTLSFEYLKSVLEENIASAKETKEKKLIHLSVNDNMGLHLMEPFNLYITQQKEAIIFPTSKLADNLHIIVTVSGIENYKRIRMNYPRLIDSVYLLVTSENEELSLAKMSATRFLTKGEAVAEELSLSIKEVCEVIMKSLSALKGIANSKWRYFGFISSIEKFHALLQKLIIKKSEDLERLLNALELLRSNPTASKRLTEAVSFTYRLGLGSGQTSQRLGREAEARRLGGGKV